MKPKNLAILESLNARMVLEKQHLDHLENLQKGDEGEDVFCGGFDSLDCPHILLRDLYFEPKYSGSIQIDCLLLIGHTAIIYEVKNYSGVWIYGEESYQLNELERPNPLIQLARTKNSFKSLLREMGYPNLNVDAVVAHVGKNFTLLGAPENRQVLLPTQLDEHFAKLRQYRYPISHQLQDLAALLPAHAVEAPAFRKMIPAYSFDSLDKGLRCETCGKLVHKSSDKMYHCLHCSFQGYHVDAIGKAIHEFKLLFPDEVLTSRKLMVWCGSGSSLRSYKRAINNFGQIL